METKHAALFFAGYIEAALFSSNDNSREDGGDPFDQNYGAADIAPETYAKMHADCDAFLSAHGAVIDGCEPSYRGCDKWSYAGHDFWLTRCGHGCGFWDGDWPEPQAEQLTEACKSFGEFDLILGDDGKIYGC